MTAQTKNPHGLGAGLHKLAGEVQGNHATPAPPMQPALAEAQRFLDLIAPDAETWSFRTIGGTTRKYRGTLEQVADRLALDNGNGAGVYVVINEGGDKAADITRIRAVFADFDPPATSAMPARLPLEPHLIVESSRGKHHAYWLVDDLPVSAFTAMQKQIIAALKSDASIHDLPRVMRLPGFIHRKPADGSHDGLPFQSRIIHESGALPYSADAIRAAFPTRARTSQEAPQAAPAAVVDVNRHDDVRRVGAHLGALIVGDGLSESAALAAMKQARAEGRWTREVPDDELHGALHGAVAKFNSGAWRPPAWVQSALTADRADNDDLLVPVSVGDILSNPALRPRSVWGSYLPRGVVALLGAHGGTGKSTIALMLAVAAALGRPLFEVATDPVRVLFASLEDAGGVARWRLATICRHWGVDPAELEGRLVVVDGTEHPELFECSGRDAGCTTASYAALEAAADGIGLVIVDNASDAFGGDEINRRQVRAFMRSLARIAKRNDAAVLLLAHVDKNTSRAGKASNGEGYSGSTAWHNSARSRMFMHRDASGRLELEHQKVNFGKVQAPLLLDWPDDGLPQLAHVTAGTAADDGLPAEMDTRRLLVLIAEFSERGEYVTTATTSRTHAARLLASEPNYPKSRKPAEIFMLLRQAERDGLLARVAYQGADRKVRERWALTDSGREFAGLAATAATAATSVVAAPDAVGAEVAATAATSGAGGMGEKERTQVAAEVGAEVGTEDSSLEVIEL